jgi:sialate O-acetylesterase
LIFPALMLGALALHGAVQLASPFGDHMILQQGRPVPVWGTAEHGEAVTVEFAGKKKSTKAGADGHWHVELKALAASSESRTLTISGSATPAPLKFNDVLVGEVWLCGGQSNMERQLGPRSGQKPIVNGEAEVAAANHPLIREFYVPQHSAFTPQSTTGGAWTVCSPASVGNFTAVGYFFARDLQQARQVPVGIIHSSIGGTPAEAWTSGAGLTGFPEFTEEINQLDRVAADQVAAKQEYLTRLARWYRDNDPGSGNRPWSDPALDTTGWETMVLPTLWEDAGHPDFDGVVWFRRSFDLPPGWTDHDVELRLSAIDDVDTTWVNGTEVGATSYYNTPRAYHVPATLLKPTGNVIAVRVLDTGGGGGIWEKNLPLEIASLGGNAAPLPLAGPWQCRFSLSLDAKHWPPMNVTNSVSAPTVLYNAMIAPLTPYAMRGVIFYQGEANAGRARQYRTLLPALIADWRRLWHQGDFPFLFVQIAPFRDMPPEIREAQLLAWQATKNTAMVVTIDCGDAADIHPAHKQPVGARLALAARALAYGESLEYSGPVYASMAIKGGQVVLSFSHLGGGLVAKDGPLTGFTLCGEDKIFHPAKAEITGNTVTVSSAEIARPVAVRYGWANVAAGNLFNASGLPASPFRTDVKP